MSIRTREEVLGYCEILGSISDWIVRIPIARAIADHDAEQRQRIAELEAEVKDALECVYIPGVWACNQCEFQLIASNLYVQDGTIGPDTDTVPLCPNDGTLMRRVTWKERVSGLDKYAGERLNEIDTLKAEVARLTAMQLTHDDEQRQTIEAQAQRIKELEAKETIESVAQWADSTFGQASPISMVDRALREVDELHRGSVLRDPVKLAEEAADVCICLYRLIYHLDPQAIEKKMAINRARQWQVSEDGTGQHV